MHFVWKTQGPTDTGIRRIHGYRIRYPPTDTDTGTKNYKTDADNMPGRSRIKIKIRKFIMKIMNFQNDTTSF